MRTVRRESVKLNKAKFDALERIARALASDKQAHLNFVNYAPNGLKPSAFTAGDRRRHFGACRYFGVKLFGAWRRQSQSLIPASA